MQRKKDTSVLDVQIVKHVVKLNVIKCIKKVITVHVIEIDYKKKQLFKEPVR